MRLLRVLVLALCQYSLTRQALLHEEKTKVRVFESLKCFLLENATFSVIVEIAYENTEHCFSDQTRNYGRLKYIEAIG